MKAKNFYILNDVDRPDARHVIQIVDDHAEYLHEDLRDWGDLRLPNESSSDLELFGFDVAIVGGFAHFTQVKESSATYQDGKPRKWQGNKEFILRLK